MDIALIFYIVISVLLGISVTSYFYRNDQNIAALLCLLLLILVFLFYGMRWFQDGNIKGSAEAQTGSWPPIVNMCPDFLVSWTAPDKKIYCYDEKNIYGMKTNTSNTALTTGLTINGVTGQSAFMIKNPTANGNAQTLNQDSDGARWPLLHTFQTNSNLVNFLRWEGVWDGQKLTLEKAPLP